MKRALIAAILVGAAGLPALARWATPTSLPIVRLLKNLDSYRLEHPEDLTARFMVARVHSYAFVFGSRMAPCFLVFDKSKPSSVLNIASAEDWYRDTPSRERERLAEKAAKGELSGEETIRWQHYVDVEAAGPITDAELGEHLGSAIAGFLEITGLNAKQAEYHVGLAYLLEEGASKSTLLEHDPLVDASLVDPSAADRAESLAKAVEGGELTPDQALATADASARTALRWMTAGIGTLRGDLVARVRSEAWRERAEQEYLSAFELAAPEDATGERPKGRGGLRDRISYEAALGLMRLVELRPAHDGDAELRSRVTQQMDAIAQLPPPNWVTPIIFNMDGSSSLQQLLAPNASVEFDLDGLGARSWPWLKPDTALLVWDPDHTGNITSGLQLFGSVTWWLFPRDGYQALELLDNNRDGWLTGDELTGVAVWQDRDTDGVSDAGEVTPIEATEVSALAVTATGFDGRSPSNAHGLRLRDGRLLPTYDWVTAPAAEP